MRGSAGSDLAHVMVWTTTGGVRTHIMAAHEQPVTAFAAVTGAVGAA